MKITSPSSVNLKSSCFLSLHGLGVGLTLRGFGVGFSVLGFGVVLTVLGFGLVFSVIVRGFGLGFSVLVLIVRCFGVGALVIAFLVLCKIVFTPSAVSFINLLIRDFGAGLFNISAVFSSAIFKKKSKLSLIAFFVFPYIWLKNFLPDSIIKFLRVVYNNTKFFVI